MENFVILTFNEIKVKGILCSSLVTLFFDTAHSFGDN
jgi:hypothetical protein